MSLSFGGESLNLNQLAFRPSDSCVNQLLAITHEIFEAFDCNPPLEVMSVFLDISKAFDKVWHEGLLYKLKSMGISGELYNLLENYQLHLTGLFLADKLHCGDLFKQVFPKVPF